jgi:hypothetical protein
MQVKGIYHKYLTLVYAEVRDNQSIVAVPCRDYDDYCTLPSAVEYGDRLHTRTGWNSDRQEAYYKTGMEFAKIV